MNSETTNTETEGFAPGSQRRQEGHQPKAVSAGS